VVRNTDQGKTRENYRQPASRSGPICDSK
jgi:hypothetical protein